MDGEKFDELIRNFCTTRLTRWDALRGLVAGAAATLTGATLAADDTDAKNKHHKNKNKNHGKSGHAAHADGKKGKKGKNKKKHKNSGTQSPPPTGGGEGGGQPAPSGQPTGNEAPVTAQAACAAGHVLICHTGNGKNYVSNCPDASSVCSQAGHCGHVSTNPPGDCICASSPFTCTTCGSSGGVTIPTCDSINLNCDVATGFCAQNRGECSVDTDCPDTDNNPCTVPKCTVDANGVGTCSVVPGNVGQPCDDGQFCTVDEVCQADGTCGGGTTRDCSAKTDQCNLGVCDEAQDACVAQPTPGVACNDGDICTTGEICLADGTCGGGQPNPDCCTQSCTVGYYRQNQCSTAGWDTSLLSQPFPCNPTMTIGQALKCSGSSTTCGTRQAQQAAALLNQSTFQCLALDDNNPQTNDVQEICAATTAQLDAANQHDPDCCRTSTCADPTVCKTGRYCTLRGCGRR